MTVVNDPNTLIDDYLARLERAAWVLPPDRRTELVEEVRAHIAEAGSDDEVSVRTVLDRLGTPEEIVAAAQDGEQVFAGGQAVPGGHHPVGGAAQPERRLRARDIAALLLLPFGGFIFVIGWFVGVVLLWSSDRWRTSEKWLGTLVLPFGYLGVFVLGMMAGQTCVSGPESSAAGQTATVAETCSGFALPLWLGIPLLAVQLIGPALVTGLLAQRAAPGRG